MTFTVDNKFLTALQGLDEHLESNFYGLVIGQQHCFVFFKLDSLIKVLTMQCEKNLADKRKMILIILLWSAEQRNMYSGVPSK